MNAIVTGGKNGLLGPIWASELYNLGYDVSIFDMPEYDMLCKKDIETFLAANPTPDVIVHNAAIDPKPGMDEGYNPFRRYEEIIKVNLIGPAYFNELLIDHLILNGGGVIVHIGSIMGYIAANQTNYQDGWKKAFGYNDSKRALQSHIDGINECYGKHNIRAVMPSFGPFEKGLSPLFMEGFGKKIPMRRAISEEEMRAVLRFCLDVPSLAGEFRVDGGYTRVGR